MSNHNSKTKNNLVVHINDRQHAENNFNDWSKQNLLKEISFFLVMWNANKIPQHPCKFITSVKPQITPLSKPPYAILTKPNIDKPRGETDKWRKYVPLKQKNHKEE
jgi:hypothetical protein